MDTTELRKAYADFLAVASAGGFGPPPPGEWDAARILAHIYSGHNQIAALAIEVAAGGRPAYDNRLSLDEWNLRRIITRAGDFPGLIELVRQQGELLCTIAELLSKEDLEVRLPILIISNDDLIVDEPGPLSQLIQGIATIHLPRHTDQLHTLLPTTPHP